jgi:hypothetical protein
MGKLKRIVLIVAVAVGVGAVGAAGVALRAYDQATKIDRTHPESVVGEYVDAFLVQRDATRTGLYICDNPDLEDMDRLRVQLIHEEQDRGTLTLVALGVSHVMDDGRHVDTELLLSQGAGTDVRTRAQMWRFTLTDEDGWRVCGAEQIPTPSPSATPPTAS